MHLMQLRSWCDCDTHTLARRCSEGGTSAGKQRKELSEEDNSNFPFISSFSSLHHSAPFASKTHLEMTSQFSQQKHTTSAVQATRG